MKRTASDVLIETIHAWGVDVVFGLPGDGINGIIEALRKRPVQPHAADEREHGG